VKEETRQALMKPIKAREALARYEQGKAGVIELKEALSDLLSLHEERDSDTCREMEAMMMTILEGIKRDKLNACEALPALVEAANKRLPPEMRVEVRQPDVREGTPYVNLLWKGHYAGTLGTSDGTSWDGSFGTVIGGEMSAMFTARFDSLYDAVVACLLPYAHGLRYNGYVQLGEYSFNSAEHGGSKKLRQRIDKLVSLGWEVLQYHHHRDDIAYEYALLRDSKKTGINPYVEISKLGTVFYEERPDA
jgi:hypothetical protein